MLKNAAGAYITLFRMLDKALTRSVDDGPRHPFRTQAPDNAERRTYCTCSMTQPERTYVHERTTCLNTVWMNMGCCELTWMLRSAVDAMCVVDAAGCYGFIC